MRLEDLDYTNNQQVIHFVIAHARTQKHCTVNEAGERCCLYRGANGGKCFAGCLIPDEDYSPSMEGYVVDLEHVSGNSALTFFRKKGAYMPLIRKLQAIHDRSEPCLWEQQFELVCQMYGVPYPPPEEKDLL